MKGRLMLEGDDGWLRLGRILWVVFTVSVVGFFALAELVIRPVAAEQSSSLERALLAVAVAYVAISVPAKRWLLIQAEDVDSVLLRGLAMIVPLLLCEVAAVTGVLLRFLTGSSLYYVFFAVALAGLALHFPRSLAKKEIQKEDA